MSSDPKVWHREVQRFTQGWLWILFLSLLLIIPAVNIVAFMLSDEEPNLLNLLISFGATGLAVGIIAACFLILRLVTEVRTDGLWIRFYPFPWKRIPVEQASSHAAVTYSPVREYGGWGIKGAKRKRAYNVRGNEGVRIEFSDGSHVLIGSQEPRKLERAITKYLESRR